MTWIKQKVVIFPVLVLIGIVGCSGSSSKASPSAPASKTNVTTAPVAQIAYRVVWEHAIPNGGYTRYIVISPKNRNVADLKALGEELKNDTKNDRNAIILILDDERVAPLLRQEAGGQTMTDEENTFMNNHDVGVYTRNINTGFHELAIMVNGVEGETVKITY